MRLSDFHGRECLDIIADILDPVSELAKDKEFTNEFLHGNRMKAAKILLKCHQDDIIQILARLEDVAPEAFEKRLNLFTLPATVLSILSDPQFVELFTSQSQTGDASSSAAV